MSKKISELRGISTAELEHRLLEAKTELSKQKSLVASQTRVEKPSRIRQLRREIARIFTIIKEKSEKKESKVKAG